MTSLVRERFRGTINRVYRPDPSGQPMLYAAELIDAEITVQRIPVEAE